MKKRGCRLYVASTPTGRPAPAPPVSAPDPLRDVPAQLDVIGLTNIDPLLQPDLADIPPLPPPAVLPPLKVRTKGRPRKDLQGACHRRGKEMEALALLE
jgi:hypothetical protein